MATFLFWRGGVWRALSLASCARVIAPVLLTLAGMTSLSFSTAAQGQNPIQQENSLPGTPNWNAFTAPTSQTALSGFTSQISVNHGGSIDFYVTTTAPTFTIDIYRTGYYQGIGARKVQSLGSFTGLQQAIPAPDPVTGMVACTGWTKTTTLQVPSTWVTGVYLAKLTASNGNMSFIYFVVRDDGGTADLVFQTSVATYQAYNVWGGTSLYDNQTNKSVYPYAHATKVSFDRPFNTDSSGTGQYFSYEYFFVYWLEQQGYNIAYTTDVDTDLGNTPLTNHKGFLVVGHDEYWSPGMRTNTQNAINAGVNVGFFSGNTMSWLIRYEANSLGVADRVEVGYKDFAMAPGAPGPDPQWGVNNAVVTTNWGNPPVNMPQNAIIGVMFESLANASYVVQNATNWVYANTGFSNGTSVPGIVGYEYDKVVNNGFSPPGLIILSNSPMPGNDNSNSTIYTAASGARVFASGTIEWSLGLSNIQSNPYMNAGIQQTTANLLNNFIAGTPIANLSTSSMLFGSVVGVPSATQNITLTSIGTVPLNITSIAIAGTNAGDFSQTNNCPSTMAFNTSCTITVTLTATAVGTRSASVIVTDNAGNSPQAVVLNGTGQSTAAPLVNLNPASLTFANISVGSSSAPQTITVTNYGTALLSISSIASTGTNAGDFPQTNNCPSGSNTLAINGTCTITVTFRPAASGNRSASISVTDNATGSPQTVPAMGTSITPTVFFQDGFEAGNFNLWNLGSSDSTGHRTVQSAVVNSGNDAAQFTNTGSQYSYIYTQLNAGPQSQTFTRFYFQISNAAAVTMLAAGRNANGGNTWEVDYAGNRGGLDIYFWNSAGATSTFSSADHTVLANTWYCLEIQDTQTTSGVGQAWLNSTLIGTVNADLSNANPFARLLLYNGASGSFYFDDVIVGNVYNGPIAPAPLVSLNPSSLSFGNEVVGSASTSQTLNITNKGNAPLLMSGLSVIGANPADFSISDIEFPYSLPANATLQVGVTFTPGAVGNRSASLAITDNASNSPQIVPLTGTGITPGPAVTINPTNLTFGNQMVGTTSASQAITVTSSGTTALTFNSITVTGTNPGDFTESDNCVSGTNPLPVNSSCTINIAFAPTASGSRSASVTLNNNASTSPQAVSISGTGFTGIIYFSDGFESGNFNNWNQPSGDSNGTRTVETTVVHSGKDAAAFTIANSSQYDYIYTAISSPQTLTYTRFYFQPASGVTGDTILAEGRNVNGGNVWEIDYNSSRQGLDFYFWNSSGAVDTFSSANGAIITGNWYSLEVQDTETTSGQAQAWLNGTSIGTLSDNFSTANPFDRLLLFSSDVGTIYFDDVVVSNTYNGPIQAAKPTTTTVTANVNPASYGQTVTFTATVQGSGGTPTGTITFLNGGATLGTATLASGSAPLNVSTLPVGANSITAQYSGDNNFLASTSAALTETINPVATTTTVVSSQNPAPFGQSVTFTATIQAGTGNSATGTVTFLDGTTTLGTATVSNNSAQFSTSTLPVGSHSITASYGGSTNFAPSTSAALTETVNQGSTTTTLTSNLNPAQFSQSVTFTAAINAGTGNSVTGTVTFTDGATTLGTATVSNNSAQFTISTLAVGSHSITASYGGNTNFAGSTSALLTQTINPLTTTTSIASNLNPAAVGQSVTFTATIQAGTGNSATGTVTFLDGTTTLGSAAVSNNSAQFTTSTLAVGSHSITASYGGSTNFAGSTSSPLTETVNAFTSTTTLSSNLNPASFGQTVTFSATVQGTGGTPTGSVTFFDGAAALGTVALTTGAAQLQVSTFNAGTHSITAQYSGDSNFSASTSAVLTETVNALATSTALASNLNPSTFGQAVTLTATVQAGSGLTVTGTITFMDGSTTLGTAPLASNSAQFTTSSLATGSHSLTAVYGGATNFSGSTSSALTQTVNQVTTTTTVASSLNPASFGQSVTFTATIQAGTGNSATGSVTFLDGTTTLATVTVSNNSAQFSTSTLAVGSHSITASYGGSTNFSASTSSALTETVNQVTTTTTVASSLNPAQFAQSVTFTATIQAGTGNSATGTVTFLDGSTTLGTAAVSNNSAQFTISTLVVGSHSITASYGGSTNFTASTSSLLTETVNPITTTTTVASSLNPAQFGQAVTFTASVQAGAGNSADGTVTFLDGTTALGTVPVSNNSAQFATSSLAVGSHSITASYSGSTNFAASTSASLTETVTLFTTTTTLASNLNPATYGQTVTLTATVQSGSGSPTGSITFLDGATTLGTVPLASGSAQLSVSTFTGGSHSLTAKYSGDSNFAPSTSAGLTQTVNPLATTTTLASSLNPASFGQSVTFTAAIQAGGNSATGTVTFLDGTTTLGTAAVSNNSAQFTTSALNAGSHSITASYGGSANFGSSTSAALTETVNQVATTTTVASNLNPSTFGQSVTFTATIQAGGNSATGTVTFLDGTTTLGSSAVSNNSAQFAISTLAAGSHSITASYSGSTNFTASTSAALTDTVNQATTTTTVTSSLNPATAGQNVTFTATINAGTGNSATGTVTFMDGTTTLGTATVSSNSAQFSTTTLAVGTHSITAVYGGSANFVGSTSAALTETINSSTAVTYFSDGFESGNFSKWTLGSSDSTGTRTVQTSVVHSGNDAASFTNTGAQYSYIYTSFTGGAETNTFTKFSFQVTSTSTGTILAIGRNASGGNVWEIDYDNRGGLDVYFWTSTGSLVSVTTPSGGIVANTWYTVELQDTEATSGQGQVWLNGTLAGSVSANLSTTKPYARLMLFDGAPGTFYFDDVIVANTFQ